MDFSILREIKEDLWTYLKNTDKKIVMYGTGNGADKIIDILAEENIPLYGIFASDDFARGQNFRGYIVKKYSDFKEKIGKFIVLVSFATQREEVLENIYRIDVEQELYAPDVPVFGEGLFNMEYFLQHKKQLEYIYNRLCDDLSRKTFVCSVAYKLTGKIKYLIDCETTKDEITALLKENIKSKNYIDIGAYTGDTVEEYCKTFGTGMNVYAFEPDIKNYIKMIQRFERENICSKCFNIAAWNTQETLYFAAKSGRASSTVTSGSKKLNEIQADRVDNLVNDEIGFIKIDAEGSDKNVISGLSKIINASVPCMKIAAYHRTDDYTEIPETVFGIYDNYKLYMRHLPYVPCWDTDFIFVPAEN